MVSSLSHTRPVSPLRGQAPQDRQGEVTTLHTSDRLLGTVLPLVCLLETHQASHSRADTQLPFSMREEFTLHIYSTGEVY